VAYQWKVEVNPGNAVGNAPTLADANKDKATLTLPSVGVNGASLKITLEVSDSADPARFDEYVIDDFKVIFVNQDPVPVAVARLNGAPVSQVDEGIPGSRPVIQLDGSGSSDPNPGDSIASYEWSYGGSVLSTSDSVNFTIPDVGIPSGTSNTLSFQLTVTDSQGASAETSLLLPVRFVNQQPVAVARVKGQAGPVNVAIGDEVDLDGSGSTDPDTQTPAIGLPENLKFRWDLVQGPPGWNPAQDSPGFNPNAAKTKVVAPTVAGPTEVRFRLVAASEGDPNQDDTLQDAAEVAFILTPQLVSVSAEVAPEEVILGGLPRQVTARAVASNPDGSNSGLTYRWQVEKLEGPADLDPAGFIDSALLNQETFSFNTPAAVGSDALLQFTVTVTTPAGLSNTGTALLDLIQNIEPTAPTVNWPPAGEVVDALELQSLTLSVNPSSDPNNIPAEKQAVAYQFVLFQDGGDKIIAFEADAAGNLVLDAEGLPYSVGDDTLVAASANPLTGGGVSPAPGANTVKWIVDPPLAAGAADDHFFFWMARACDGLQCSPWRGLEAKQASAFFVNTVNDPPGAPGIASPKNGSQVSISDFKPILTITDSTDPDSDGFKLTYEFRVYENPAANDEDYARSSGFQPSGGSGSIFWKVAPPLAEDVRYWWKVRAKDAEGAVGPWSELAGFIMNAENKPPGRPVISFPENGALLAEAIVTLQVQNAADADADADALEYLFELDATGLFNPEGETYQSSGFIAEGGNGVTSWPLDEPLADNHSYFWRVTVRDSSGAENYLDADPATPAAEPARFFVDFQNDPPSVPALDSPEDKSIVNNLGPTLKVFASSDPDPSDKELLYDFELFKEGNLATPIASASGLASTSWVPAGVEFENQTTYYWRARAKDRQGLPTSTSAWSSDPPGDLFSFTTNAFFILPNAPVLNSPFNGGTVNTSRPALSVKNPFTAAGEPALKLIEFELYREDKLLPESALVLRTQKPPGGSITSLTIADPLADQTVYYWRARSINAAGVSGSWMPTAAFTVDVEAQNIYEVETVAASLLFPDLTAVQEVEVVDQASPINGVRLEVPPGAITGETLFSIGIARGVPALPAHLIPNSQVIALGPENTVFGDFVTVSIPHSDPDFEELNVYTFDEDRQAWVEVSVIERTAQAILAETKHFSLFVAATPSQSGSGGSGGSGGDGGSGGGGGGGGCFIRTISGEPDGGFSSVNRVQVSRWFPAMAALALGLLWVLNRFGFGPSIPGPLDQ
jgi:hypothetical protein